MFSEEYTSSVGRCRDSGGSHSGEMQYSDRDCESKCDAEATCTGYELPDSTATQECWTYTTSGASGNGATGYKCYTKNIGISCYNVFVSTIFNFDTRFENTLNFSAFLIYAPIATSHIPYPTKISKMGECSSDYLR